MTPAITEVPGTVLATYQCPEGTRELVGERISGNPTVRDVPVGFEGKVYLVEKGLATTAELEGLIGAYLEDVDCHGRCPFDRWADA